MVQYVTYAVVWYGVTPILLLPRDRFTGLFRMGFTLIFDPRLLTAA
jgi:hypothetical protein